MTVVPLRLAGATEVMEIRGELEIPSLCGTLSPEAAHLPIAVADSSGALIAGHLGAGPLGRTTARCKRKTGHTQSTNESE